MTTFQAAWPIVDQSITFDALAREARIDLRAMLAAQGLTMDSCGSLRRTPTHMTWTGPVRPRMPHHDPSKQLDVTPLLSLVKRLDVPSLKALERAAKTGRITRAAADRICCQTLGVHPCEVFGEAWWAA